jgi:hypothetical protein
LYYKLYIWEKIPDNLLKVVKNHIKWNSQKFPDSKEWTQNEETPETLVDQIKDPKTPETERNSSLEKLKNIQIPQEKIQEIIWILWTGENEKKIKNALIQSILKSWYVIKSQSDLDFLKKHWDEKIKGQVEAMKFDTIKWKTLEIIEGDSISTVDTKETPNSWKTSFWQVFEDMQEKWINEKNLQEIINKVWEIPNIWEGLKKFLEFFVLLFKNILGKKSWEVDENVEAILHGKKIEALTNILKPNSNNKLEFFENISFNNKNELDKPEAEKTQIYIKSVQGLVWVDQETQGEWDKKIFIYGDKTIQAVKNIQEKIRVWKTPKITGKFDEQTARDYLNFLKEWKQNTSVNENTEEKKN